ALDRLITALPLSKTFVLEKYTLSITGVCEPRHEPYLNYLHKLVNENGLSERVNFLGHVGGVEKQKLYSESYALVLPSETENFGNVVVEALNQGTPVIASKGTPWSLLEQYGCGFHVENSPQVLAEALDKILSLDNAGYLSFRKNA